METSCTPLHCQQTIFFTRDKVNRYMPEVDIIFKQIKYSPSAGIWKFYVECNSNRIVFIYHIKYISKTTRYHYFQIHFMSSFYHDLSKAYIIFDHQYNFISA